MGSNLSGAGCLKDTLGRGHLGGCPVREDEELGRFERGLVFHNTVLGNANAVQPGAQCTQSAHHHGAFQRSDNPTDHWAKYDQGSDAGDKEKRRPKQQAPKAAPKGPEFTPDLHALAGIVVADNVLFGVIVFADDGQLFHVEPRALEFFDALFCLGVGVVDANYCVILSHGFLRHIDE